MNSEIMITVEKISKLFKLYPNFRSRIAEWVSGDGVSRHRDFWALKDISFQVPRGECFGIVGQNGAGKSTLLKILTGSMYPNSGRYETRGRVLSLLELGTGFNPELTGRQNVVHSAMLQGFPRDHLTPDRMQRVEEFAELGDFFDRPIKLYSSGMHVRLGFSMFVGMDPDVLIVDEALSVGDIFFQQKCFKIIHDFLARGVTMLFVSHDPQAVRNLCSTAILLSHGEMEFLGPPEETISRYFANSRSLTVPANYEMAAPTVTSEHVPERADILARSILNGRSRHGPRKLEVEAARIMDDHGRDTLLFEVFDELKCQVLLRAHEPIAKPNIGFHLYDRLGNLVFGAGTTQLKYRLPDMEAGEECVVSFRLGLAVEPGEYTFSVCAGQHSPEDRDCDGVFQDVHEMLGPILVTFRGIGVRPFYGIARLPMEIIGHSHTMQHQ